jgi:multicomponent Na+:H+ antiporter subunit A
VAAIYGQAVEVRVGLWHGVTPMLLLSGAVVGIGALLFVFWIPLHYRLRTMPRLDRYDVEHAYDALLRRVRETSRVIAERLQRGDLRDHLGVIFAAAGAFVVWGLVATGREPRLPTDPGALRVGPAVLALVGLAGGIAATGARSLLAAMIATGLTGLVAALTFLTNGAPDLALTQFAVESLVVVLLTAALLALPLSAPTTRSRGDRRRDAGVAAGLSVLLFAALLDMSAAPQPTELSAFFGARSYVEAFGRNVVNVILVDFRGFDTLGEAAVIALSAVIAWSLLGPSVPGEDGSGGPRRSVFVLTFASPLLFWLLTALAVVALLRGHNEIGGGFVGGLTAALAFAIVALTHGVTRAREKLRFHPLSIAGGGLLLAVASGLPGLVAYGDYLRHIWVELTVFGVHVRQGTTLLFDFGVYLAVLGAVLAFLFGLTRQTKS